MFSSTLEPCRQQLRRVKMIANRKFDRTSGTNSNGTYSRPISLLECVPFRRRPRVTFATTFEMDSMSSESWTTETEKAVWVEDSTETRLGKPNLAHAVAVHLHGENTQVA